MRIIIFLLCAATAVAQVPHVDQAARWRAAVISPKSRIALDVVVAQYKRNEYRYQATANARPGTIPPQVICAIHWREADANWKTNLGQGDSLQRRTVHVPAGRIPNVPPPYTWEQAAEDALFTVDKMDRKDWTTVQGALTAIELYNGPGYMHAGKPPSPYLWAGTSLYGPPWGKFSSDGHYNPNAHDAQLGVCAILRAMQAHGIDVGLPWPVAQ